MNPLLSSFLGRGLIIHLAGWLGFPLLLSDALLVLCGASLDLRGLLTCVLLCDGVLGVWIATLNIRVRRSELLGCLVNGSFVLDFAISVYYPRPCLVASLIESAWMF